MRASSLLGASRSYAHLLSAGLLGSEMAAAPHMRPAGTPGP